MERPVEILLVEDNPNDIQLTRHAFREHHLANALHVVRDGPKRSTTSSGRGSTRAGGSTATPGSSSST